MPRIWAEDSVHRTPAEGGWIAGTACAESTCSDGGIHDFITLKSYDSAVKRRFLAILLFLLLGAVVNVAVAWGCVGRKIEPHVHVVFDEDANHVWSCCRPADWPAIPDRGARYRRVGFNVKWSVYEWRDSYGSFAALDSAYGFPFPSMRC